MTKGNKVLLWGTEVQTELHQHIVDENEIKSLDELLSNPLHGFHETCTGEKMHYLKYLPEAQTKPKAICVWQHGIGGCSEKGLKLADGNYLGIPLLARMLMENGFALYAPDMLGHGFSEGCRFYIPNGQWSVNRDGLEKFARFAASEHDDNTPLFLMGESYGACLVIHVARMWQNNPKEAPSGFRGFCIVAPAIVGDLPPAIVVFILRNIFAPILPKWRPFFMPHPVNPDRIWKDERVRNHFTSEKQISMGLHHGGQTFRLGTAAGLLSALESVREVSIPGLTVPFAVAHGSEDLAVPIEGTEFLLKHADTPEEDRAVRKIIDGYHDLICESTSDETISFFINWMNDRL